MSTVYLLNPLSNYFTKCSSKWNNVQELWLSYVDSRSRPHFKVICFTLKCLSISLEPFRQFSIFPLSETVCRTMAQLHRLKVEVFKVIGFALEYLSAPYLFNHLYKVFNKHFSQDLVWRINESARQTHGQGHRLGLWVLLWIWLILIS